MAECLGKYSFSKLKDAEKRVQWTVLTATAKHQSSKMVFARCVVVCINRTATKEKVEI